MRRSAARRAAGKYAAAKECSLERGVAMNAAATETGHLPRGVQPRHRLAVGGNHAAVEIGLQTAESFTCQNPQAHRNQRPGGRIEQFVRARGADQAIAEIAPGGATGGTDERAHRRAIARL